MPLHRIIYQILILDLCYSSNRQKKKIVRLFLIPKVMDLTVFFSAVQENEFDEVVSLLNLLEIRSDMWQRAMYESSASSPPLPGQPPSAASSDLSTRTDPENLSPGSRFEEVPTKRRRRSSVPVNLSIDTKHDEETSVTQSNWRVSKVSPCGSFWLNLTGDTFKMTRSQIEVSRHEKSYVRVVGRSGSSRFQRDRLPGTEPSKSLGLRLTGVRHETSLRGVGEFLKR